MNILADYLVDKCKRFDNLLIFCSGGLLGQYESARNNQLAENKLVVKLRACTKNPPADDNTELIDKCLKLGTLNSTYYSRPPQLSASISNRYTTYRDNSATVTFHLIAKNSGFFPLTLEAVKYGLFKQDKKLKEGCIGRLDGCASPNSYTIQGSSNGIYEFDYTTGSNQSETLGVPPYVINGTYYYFNPNSTILTKPFNFVVH